MREILIISPDPETSRTLELKFELEGYEPRTFVDTGDLAKSVLSNLPYAFILDMLDTSSEHLDEVREMMRIAGSKKGCKTAVILPRGLSELNEKKMSIKPDFTIRRPYDISHLVKLVGDVGRSMGLGSDEVVKLKQIPRSKKSGATKAKRTTKSAGKKAAKKPVRKTSKKKSQPKRTKKATKKKSVKKKRPARKG